ncbi:MAG: xanthine dehydrogenase family protein subunit M [Chitinophagaceae bacterium]
MNQFQYVKPSDTKSAIAIIAKDPSAQFIAGGTNLIDLMKKGIVSPEKLVDINNLPLRSIEKRTKSLRIGALALNSDVAENDMIKQHHPLLSLALNAGASPQLRNMATVGGNILQRTRCSYFYDTFLPCNKRQPGSGCGAIKGYNRMHAVFNNSDACIAVHPSDMCVALSALNAEVVLNGLKGEHRISINDFLRLPGDHPEKDNKLEKAELIVAVEIPDNVFTKNFYYLKVRDRSSYAFALVSVAVALEIHNGTISEARVALGGVAHKPWRLYQSEKYLTGKKVSEANFKEASGLAILDAKAYEYNAFKLKLIPRAIVEALQKASAMT